MLLGLEEERERKRDVGKEQDTTCMAIDSLEFRLSFHPATQICLPVARPIWHEILADAYTAMNR